MDQLERMRNAKTGPTFKAGRESGIFLNWKDNDNILRLAGDYVETRTHYVAPNIRQKLRGVCKSEAFEKGDQSISQVINCLNWDLATESEKPRQTCPICKLYALASEILAKTTDEKEKKFYGELKAATAYKVGYKWNCLDRDNPTVISTENGVETKILGFKIASLGREAFGDIKGIFMQCGFDISSPTEGVDIKVVKGASSGRVSYSAQVILQGKGVKQTPFTAEESALQLRDIKQICGKQYDAARIIAAMHDDLVAMLTIYEEDEKETSPLNNPTAASAVDAALAEKEQKVPTPAPKVKVPAPVKAASAPTAVPAPAKAAPVAPAPATAPVKSEDGDDLPF